MTTPARTLPLVAVILGIVAGCSTGDDDPRWLRLAEGYEPEELSLELSDHGLRVSSDGPLVCRVESEIAAAEWTGSPAVPGLFWVDRPLGGFDRTLGEARRPALEIGGAPLEHVEASAVDVARLSKIEPGSFAIVHGKVFALMEPGTTPGDARLSVTVERGSPSPRGWRVTIDRFTAHGIPVWPGERAVIEADVSGVDRLAFATVARAMLPVAEGELVFRLLVGDAVLFEERRPATLRAEEHWHSVALPADLTGTQELRFEVDGPPAISAFLAPTLGPAEPPASARPDVVLFVADTLRADALGCYGGDARLTPELDALAARSRRFERAWSPASWTLPAHASLFTGLYPRQHGSVEIDYSLATSAVTLAERLSDAGYRTIAITGRGFVSRDFGLDQGFEIFDELVRDLPSTLAAAEAAISADDGRPLFLFVHTYHAHAPYRASEEARALFPSRGEPRDYRALMAEIGKREGHESPEEPMPADERDEVRALHELYLAGVHDLDRGVGELVRRLHQRGLLPGGTFFFTSDHGEAFGEHGLLDHGTGVWDEHVRIPLLALGPDFAPGVASEAASLVDLPRTIAEVADLAAPDAWGGASLVDPVDRPVYSYQCARGDRTSYVALVDGRHKLIVDEEHPGVPRWAVDLEADPAEERHGADAVWAAPLAARHRGRLDELCDPVLESTASYLSAAARAGLEDLGYTDD